MYLAPHAFHVPNQIHPCIGWKRFAVDRRGLPAIDVIPDVPLARAVEITLRSPHPSIPPKCLIDVELQRLRSSGIVDVKVEVISELAHAVSATDGIEVQHVAIAVRALRRNAGPH